GPGHEPLAVLPPGIVADMGHRGAAEVLDDIGLLLGGSLYPVADDDAATLLGEAPNSGAADALARACHNAHLSFEAPCSCRSRLQHLVCHHLPPDASIVR